MSSVNDIRSTFLGYFGKNGHQVVDSSPLVPRNDPTLMFTNAGMVQFKNLFTGVETRDYSRAATSQKCVRAGASITTSTMSATPPAIIPSLKCWGIFPLAITSRKKRSFMPGPW